MNLTEATRAYIYRVALAVLAALSLYGIIGPDEIPVWTGIIIAVLGLGTNVLAVRNTSTERTARREDTYGSWT